MKIISLSYRHYEPVLKMIGRSGKNYPFRWESKLGYYVYETESQEDVSDLFEGCMHWNHGYLSILLPEVPRKKARKRVKPDAKKQTVAV
jgi:hypothetical protein